MLSFFELTVQVMRKLGVQANSKVGIQMAHAIAKNDPDLAPPFDQVFGQLQRVYTTEKIEKEITRLLKTPKNAITHNHKVVLRLSKDARGLPFVVTTNFDHLFERAMPRLRRWLPPMLPVMTGDSLHSGVVYLHGRLGSARHTEGPSSPLVLGSGDFGRAYLADGWATAFFRQLLERKTVVLLGYSAGDPPIRYLLEGLNSSTSARLQPIYAFDRGEENEVSSKWRELGVSGIPFTEFQDLWGTLEVWAERADDPDGWRAKTLSMAQSSPRALKAYQRGQIAALAATPEGARGFAEADPPPCAEWLCVLDRNIRYSQPFRDGYGDEAREIDPFLEYGLDDDPPRLDGMRSDAGGLDFLGKLPADTDSDIFFRLAGASPKRRGAIPRRLWSLTRWFEAIAHEWIAIWWASRQLNLHPDIIWSVNRRLTGHGAKFSDDVQRVWNLILEIEEERGEDDHDHGWFDFVGLLKRGGWSSATYRSFEKAIKPRLKVEASFRSMPHLQLGDGHDSDRKIEELIRFSVHCPSRHDHDIDIPVEALPRVVGIVTRSLERATDLLEESGRSAVYFHLPAIEPDAGRGERYVPRNGPAELFLWATKLFSQLAKSAPQIALAEAAKWPPDDRFFFDKFRLFAWRIDTLFDPDHIAEGILTFRVDSFWDPYLQRDLLHLLRAKWGSFSALQRKSIEDRLCQPPNRFSERDHTEVERQIRYDIGSRLGWLDHHGCQLSQLALSELAEIRIVSDWTEDLETKADRDMDGRVGWVERRVDPANLDGVAVSALIARSIELSGRDQDAFVEYAPFEGVVSERPSLALSALAFEARHQRYPVGHWRQLLSKWPKDVPPRTTRLCGLRLRRLPQQVQFELRAYLASWIRDFYTEVATSYPDEFYGVWDGVFAALQEAGSDATTSGIGQITVGGNIVQRSRRTLDHAINGPIGQLVEALFASMGKRKFKKNERIPSDLSVRLERSLDSVGEGADHAASLIAQRLNWLFFVDKAWTTKAIVPIFELSHPRAEAAWNALLFTQQVPQPTQLFSLLKLQFLRIFDERKEWLSENRDERHAVTVLIIATYWNKNNKAYITDEECRRVLQSVDEIGRQTALWSLHRIVKQENAWKSFGKRFFASIWPQEARFQTGAASNTMLLLAGDEPDQFLEVVDTIKDFLRPIDHPDMFIFRHRREDEKRGASLAKRWPHKVLEVADRIVGLKPAYVPNELSALLADIAEADPTLRGTTAWRRLNELNTR
ncbi:SIR2 family protein [Agrobacterium sp. ES01]|uniref:SIR2 family protein n=1 Tax=Agrobacterium sp. ES01 TaxID=3420714 RepID=UPI003D0AC6AC